MPRMQGHYDVGFNNPGRLDVSGNTTALAKDGIVLKHHYVFYWRDPLPPPHPQRARDLKSRRARAGAPRRGARS